MNILGISAFFHDSAAALLQDGRIAAAAQEERFTRRKHDDSFPAEATRWCLQEAGIGIADLDAVVFYEKPLVKFERLLETALAFAPRGFPAFVKAMPVWLQRKLHIPREIDKGLDGGYDGPICFATHHESHAASGFYPSPFDEAAILTLDGVGEWSTATWGTGHGNQIRLEAEMRFPHSPGLLYSAFTLFCGFRVNSGEYKLMGLAPYGEPKYADTIRRELIDLKDDGSLRLNMRHFNFAGGLTMTSRSFDTLFGGPPRQPEDTITQREMDLAASIQSVTTEIVLRMARHAKALTGARNLCLAGGVALNCVTNGELLRAKIFDDIWIPSAAGDAGGALGAAMFVSHQLLGTPRRAQPGDSLKGALLGPAFNDAEVRAFLDAKGAHHTHFPRESELLTHVAAALGEGKIVGWFHGRMEFGPRALGSRSILGDPRNAGMQSRMNVRIKFRESFRPFAPSCLVEDAAHWFDLDRESPYMLLVAPVRAQHRLALDDAQRALLRDPDLCKRVNVPRSALPAITHVDFSARVQTVSEERNGRYARLIREFKRQTGCGVLVNTSFNVRGEPIVCTPEDAWRCFMACDMDVLVLENCVLTKEDQPQPTAESREQRLREFSPD